MKSYKTYQECKIENPECEVCTDGEVFSSVELNSLPYVTSWKACNPADHCMTVKEFLDAGYRFEVGDLWVDYDGDFMAVGKIGVNHMNKPHERDFERYILRAAALEKPKRTKVEYEKVEFEPNEIWKAFKEHQEVGYLYVNTPDGFECLFDGVFNLAMAISQGDQLYRRIETEIDERQEFIDAACDVLDGDAGIASSIGRLYDSGRFKIVN